jgi:hypothetical protein
MNVLEIWPASSPDLAPTEMAWSIIGRKFVTANVKTDVERAWNELHQGMIDRLVLDFWRRCGLCQVCQSKTISRPLFAHRATASVGHRPGDGCRVHRYIDGHVPAVVGEAKCRTSVKRVSERLQFADYNASSVKQRWQFLVYPAGNEEGSGSELTSRSVTKKTGWPTSTRLTESRSRKCQGTTRMDEVEHEDGQQDRAPAAGDDEEEGG